MISIAAATGTGRRRLRLVCTTLLLQAAAGLTLLVLAGALHYRNMADFHVLRGAGADIVHGRAGGFIYPPPSAFAMVPFSYLPYAVAAVVWLAILVVTIPLILRTLDVRDPRCYALAFLYAPTLAVFGSGALSSLLALLVAVAWRHRDRPRVAAAATAAAVVSKIFLWPLLIWLAATRLRTASAAAVGTIALAFGGWLATGFAGLSSYAGRLSDTAALEQDKGYSLIALGHALGISDGAGRICTLVLTGVLLAASYAAGRRGDDRRSFVFSLAAALAVTPISWLHYFVLMLVPLALTRRTLAWQWLLPLGYWGAAMRSEGDVRMILFATLTTTFIFVAALQRRDA